MRLPADLCATAPLPLREREYSPSSCIGGDYRPFVEAYRRRSVAAREAAAALGGRWSRHACGAEGAGPGPGLPALELCLPPQASAAQPAPLLLFVHGGYWQELSAADSLFAATACVRRGLAFAALDYTLAPAASLPQITTECRQSLRWLAAQAGSMGVAADRVVIAGSSAGAHLCAHMAVHASVRGPAAEGAALRPSAAVLLSGVYWLEPLIGTSIDAALRLDLDTARRASPGFSSLASFPPAVVAWGENETAAFKAQSRHFSAALGGAGAACETLEVAGRNHFDVVFDLLDEATPLGQRVLALFG